MKVTEEKGCRVCSGDIETVLDFGEIFLSGFVKDQSEAHKAPLALSRCTQCGLVQLRDTVELDSMYRQYWYMSSLNKSMVSSLQNVVDDVISKVDLQNGDTVLDIGCNDGTMLGMYPKHVSVVGFDPALNLTKPPFGVFINDYFSARSFRLIGASDWNDDYSRSIRNPKVITAIAMFYDLPDPVKFTKEVSEILADDGIFVVQFTDLLSMFRLTAFDNICHEHLEYYRLSDVVSIFEKAGLEAIDVSYNAVNGGSIRVTAAHKGAYDPSRSVSVALEKEREFLSNYTLEDFKNAIRKACTELGNFIDVAMEKGTEIFLLGASTKGNTLLQVCGINDGQIPYAAEVNQDKFGLRTVGSNILIVPEDRAFSLKPDFFLVPVWHFEESLVKKDKIREYIQKGGALVFPLPYLHFRDRNNTE